MNNTFRLLCLLLVPVLYMTLRRLGRDKQAAKALATIGDNLDLIGNQDYLTLLQLYQGKRSFC